MACAEQFLDQQMHPTVIISAFRRALEDMQDALNDVSTPIDTENPEEMRKIIQSAIGTKFISKWSKLACDMAIKAVSTVVIEDKGQKEIDIKRYAKVEKVADTNLIRPINFLAFKKILVCTQFVI